jgi:nucleoredoxin
LTPAFTPVLIDFYKQLAKSEKLEIVYISSDRTAADFQGYYGKMPWLALPNDEAASKVKTDLINKMKIRGIPSLIVLDVKTGLLISADARSQVQSTAGNTAKANELIAAWKTATPVPIEEGLAGGTGIMAIGYQIMMAVLKNPIYIFGMLYIIKWISRKIAKQQMGIEDGNDTAAEDSQPIPDDEF